MIPKKYYYNKTKLFLLETVNNGVGKAVSRFGGGFDRKASGRIGRYRLN